MKKQIFNPYMPSYEYVPDGEPHIFGGRVYVYGSHDQFNGHYYCLNDYVCYSADINDLTQWVFHGTIYRKDQDPHHFRSTSLYAPDVAQGPDGRFYLYYSVENSSVISVAVCDTPAGKYEYYGDVKWQDGTVYGTKHTDPFQFDPAVYVENGRVYLFSGFKLPFLSHHPWIRVPQKMRGCYVVELAKDMLTVLKKPKEVLKRRWKLGLHNFFEASSLRKFGDTYYFVYSSNFSHELCYATSDKPDGEFVYRGVLYSNGNVGINGSKRSTYPIGNNHGSLIKINGNYYVFGHRRTHRGGISRQAIADRIYMNSDGSFTQAEYTSSGLNDGPLQGVGCYPAYITCYLQGKRRRKKFVPYITQSGPDRDEGENQYVTNWIDSGQVGFTYFNFQEATSIRVRIRGCGKGTITISNFPQGTSCGKIDVDISSSDVWTNFTGKLCMQKGILGIYMTYNGTGMIEMIEFEIGKVPIRLAMTANK